MNWDRITGNWKQMTGSLRERYGCARDEADKQVREWENRQQ